MNFIKIGQKAIRADKIEAVTLYRNELTIHCPHNGYTVYYNNAETAEQAYEKVLEKLVKEG